MKTAVDGIDRRLGKPLHEQLAAIIRGAILEGYYRPGERIEPEREFMRASKLSYHTVARAFRNLADEGLVVRRVGSGTFVSEALPTDNSSLKTIGVVYHCHDEFFASIFAGIQDECRQRGHVPLPILGTPDASGEDRVLKEAQKYELAGMVAIPNLKTRSHRELLRLIIQHMPVVLMDSYLPETACDAVTVDNEEAAYQLTRHLLDLGHRQIVFLAEEIVYPHVTTVRDRVRGTGRALEQEGADNRQRRVIQYPDLEPGKSEGLMHRIVLDLLDRPQATRPTAVMCDNDFVAAVVLRLLRQCGLRVPQDVSVTGFDDQSFAQYADPPLTTAAQPLERIGRHAVRLLFDRLEEPNKQPVRVVLDAPLVVRESTGIAPGASG